MFRLCSAKGLACTAKRGTLSENYIEEVDRPQPMLMREMSDAEEGTRKQQT